MIKKMAKGTRNHNEFILVPMVAMEILDAIMVIN